MLFGVNFFSWVSTLGASYTLSAVLVYAQLHFSILGQRLVSPGVLNETSSIMVESVTRSTTDTCYSAIPKSSSDASKVVSRGAGLSRAFMGQKNSFSVDCSKAGNFTNLQSFI